MGRSVSWRKIRLIPLRRHRRRLPIPPVCAQTRP